MFVFGLLVGAVAVGAVWYFWPKISAEEKALLAKLKALEAADKAKVQALLKKV